MQFGPGSSSAKISPRSLTSVLLVAELPSSWVSSLKETASSLGSWTGQLVSQYFDILASSLLAEISYSPESFV